MLVNNALQAKIAFGQGISRKVKEARIFEEERMNIVGLLIF